MADLANSIAAHPHFARAWVQKVCTWANGAVCDEDDPELLRIATLFTSSNFNWNIMVREMMLSPLVTYEQVTQTTSKIGQVAGLMRRSQLCGIFTQRLGVGDICGLNTIQAGGGSSVAALALNIPGDTYARGLKDPPFVTQPDIFITAGVENVCAGVADAVLSQNAAATFASQDPNVAIPSLVHEFMAIAPAIDQEPISILRSHYDAVLASGADPQLSWRATFVLACTSPLIVGFDQAVQ